MQSLVTWCGGLSVRVFPPDSYIVILTSTVMGLRVGLWEVMGAMPYGSPEGALQFSSLLQGDIRGGPDQWGLGRNVLT